MPRRHPALPSLWLLTDERQGDALWPALGALPRGSGVVVRHHGFAAAERHALLLRVARIARHRGLVLACEVPSRGRTRPRVVVIDERRRPTGTIWIARARSIADTVAARRAGAAAVFVSPVFATRTHPGARALGPTRAVAIARGVRLPAIALGGVTARRFTGLRLRGFYGWAAIDGLTPGQKRNAVPT